MSVNSRFDALFSTPRDGRLTRPRVGAITALLASSLLVPSVVLAQPCPSFQYLGNQPREVDNSDWAAALQGVAHYGQGWFFTNLNSLRKIPFTHNLNTEWPGTGVGMPAELSRLGYNHFGDLDAYGEFLFVPVDGGSAPALAVFRATDLGFVGYKPLREQESDGGWVAVEPTTGILYTSNSSIDRSNAILYRYSINLDALRRTRNVATSITLLSERLTLLESDGSPLRESLGWMQGGVFSPWGDLFLLNGGANKADREIRGGIHVFSPSGRMITEFRVDNYNPGFSEFEEAEALDWLDLGAQFGQLHVVVIDHDEGDALEAIGLSSSHLGDDLYFKHYAVSYGRCDGDGDGVLDDGDHSGSRRDHPCTRGERRACDDNCPTRANSNQADADGDGIGDACDTVARAGRVVGATLRAEPANYSGTCPTVIRFRGEIVTDGPAVVKYTFTRSDGATDTHVGTLTFRGAGRQAVDTTWSLGGARFAYQGWEALKVLEPQQRLSSRAAFSVRCR